VRSGREPGRASLTTRRSRRDGARPRERTARARGLRRRLVHGVRIPASARNARAHWRAQLPDQSARNRVHHLCVPHPLPAPRSLTDVCAVGAVTAVLVVLTLWHRVRVRRAFAANMARTDATGLPPGWVRGPGLARPAQAHVVGPMPAYMAPVSFRSSSPLSFLRSSRAFVVLPTTILLPLERPSPTPFGSRHRPVPDLLCFAHPDRPSPAACLHRPQPSGPPPDPEDVYAPPPPSYEPKGEPLPPPAGAPPPSGPPPRFEDSV
jgi:hypothetical protein